MIEESKLIKDLLTAGFDTGWAVRGEKIVLWENSQDLPNEFSEYLELDEVGHDN